MRKLLILLLFAVSLHSLYAQERTVSGTVFSMDGEPIPGANIVVKGTAKGTITDAEGHFNIRLSPDERVLQISFIGMLSEEVDVSNLTEIEVYMVEDIAQLDEVVVIGYGSSSKKLLSSSISTISEKDLANTSYSGIERAIQGKTAGVHVVQNSGTPGAEISVTIRGKSSISAGTQPLYVVDGVPVTTGDFSQLNFEGQRINAAIDINPNNIESISILKDASAAAIYGARAGNGVVLITTKTGIKDKTRFHFRAYTGFQEEWRRLDMLDAAGWKEYVSTFDSAFVGGLDPDIETDWQDEVFKRAPISNYELSMSGGSEKTTFFISGRYFNEEGIVLGSAYEKLAGRVNLDHEVSDRVKIGSKMELNYAINDRIVGDQTINGVLPNAISKPPVYAVRDSLGNYLEEGFWDNPVAIGNDVVNRVNTFRTFSNIYGEFEIFKGLTFKNQWGLDYFFLGERNYEPTTVDRGAENNGLAAFARTEIMKVTQNSTLNYVFDLKKDHVFNILAGYSFEKVKDRSDFLEGNNFPSDELEYLYSAGNLIDAYTRGEDSGLESFFGRLIYNFKSKYIATLNIRYDGSSNFGENNQFAAFPAASFAWRVSEEPFLANSDLINELKLRLSYGLTGNDKIGSFRSRSLYGSGYNYYNSAGIVPIQIPNPDLKWETTSNLNGGLDLTFLNNRINLTLDAYYNKTTDLLLDRPLPGSSGFTVISSNIGVLENKGVELLLSTVNINGEFKWITDINLSHNKNEVIELYQDQPITDVGRGGNAVFVGQPIGVFYMYKSLGVDPSTGDLVFEDVNKDGQITDADRTFVGDPTPDLIGGITNNFAYKGFELNVFFQFSYGNDIFNGTRRYAEAMKFSTNDNQLATIKDRWRKPGDRTYVPRHDGLYNLDPASSHYLEDGSYLRLKELLLGYNFKESLLAKTRFLTNARIYFKAQNLLTITPYSGMDPEVNYSGDDNIRQGTDFFTFPQARAYIVGVNLNF